ncbi:MAG: hypothetical protein Tsb0034_31520 [Ekhidna sp.]
MAFGQIPLYDYRDLDRGLKVPEGINSERSLVIISVPDEVNGFKKVGDWQKLAKEAHKAFITMGIDAIMYLNHYDLVASRSSQLAYIELFSTRKVEHVIFLTITGDKYELLIAPFSSNQHLITGKEEVLYLENNELYGLLLQLGKEVRRADQEKNNFLIPEKPNFISGLSIVEKTQLKNYPGILRRSTLAVERFTPIQVPASASEAIVNKVDQLNKEIETKNLELEMMMKSYPYDYVMIDPMSDEDLLRNRHQFVLRSLYGRASSVRQMLDYTVNESETDFISVIPVMPDQTKTKRIPKDALVHKFYIKQNVSKNVHVGEWDADESWQLALQNMIGNLIQEHQVDR